MRALMRLANLKWRVDARARWLSGEISPAWTNVLRSLAPVRYAFAPVKRHRESSPELFIPRDDSGYVPRRRTPMWRRVLRLPGAFARHYARLRVSHSRWNAARLAARMTLGILK